ncbi:MAG: hypothetical protein BGN96_15375 [Bacteroidales bacterium 45-6]|nr:MAG: hypothetical protein BGN96_15375 [Bacteroidales bacterium 45-6]
MTRISVLLLSVCMFSSCLNDFLNVQPVSQTNSDKFWKTASDATAAFTSIYADFQTNFRTQNGLTYIGWFDMRSDNFYGNPSSGAYYYSDINKNRLTSTHPGSDWNIWYKSIGTANYAIYYIPGMTDVTEATRNNLLAEAYFLRAYCYFNIIRIWGNAPMVTKPTLTVDDVTKPVRDSSKLIMDSVILKDIDKAMALVDVSKTDIYRFGVGALYSLATDVAMWNHDYANAEKYSYDLLYTAPTNGRYSLVSGANFYTTVSMATTSENIWTLKWSYQNNGFNPITQTLTGTYVLVAKPVVDLWGKPAWRKDLRRPQTIDTTAIYNSNHLTVINNNAAMWKYQPVTRFPNNTNEKYIPLYRLADIILLRAEALNKLGRYAEALTELNKIRTRAGLPSRKEADYSSATDKTYAIESDILQERQFELLGEGKRWFDLMRTGRAVATRNNYFETYLKAYNVTNYIPFTADWQLYWPILQNNINYF